MPTYMLQGVQKPAAPVHALAVLPRNEPEEQPGQFHGSLLYKARSKRWTTGSSARLMPLVEFNTNLGCDTWSRYDAAVIVDLLEEEVFAVGTILDRLHTVLAAGL